MLYNMSCMKNLILIVSALSIVGCGGGSSNSENPSSNWTKTIDSSGHIVYEKQVDGKLVPGTPFQDIDINAEFKSHKANIWESREYVGGWTIGYSDIESKDSAGVAIAGIKNDLRYQKTEVSEDEIHVHIALAKDLWNKSLNVSSMQEINMDLDYNHAVQIGNIKLGFTEYDSQGNTTSFECLASDADNFQYLTCSQQGGYVIGDMPIERLQELVNALQQETPKEISKRDWVYYIRKALVI